MKYLLDTNIVLYALKKEPVVLEWLAKVAENRAEAAISVISVIELLGYPDMSASEEKAVKTVLGKIEQIGLDEPVVETTILVRRKARIKLPDAIIAASAMATGRVLVTRNISDFRKVANLKTCNPF